MANQDLFTSTVSNKKNLTLNEAGGVAYKLSNEQALVQYTITGCFNGTFYSTPQDQLNMLLDLCKKVSPKFVAQTALYCRERAYMKDAPAFLCAYLASNGHTELLSKVFDKVINNGKMLRNFVQIMRSGVTGRKSLGSASKRLVQTWFKNRTAETIFKNSIGNSPSLVDVIKLAHPKPDNKAKEALYGYMLDKEYSQDALPQLVKDFENYKKNQSGKVPNVPFQMLTALNLDSNAWTQIARNVSWQTLRMNLNTFNRHGVFKNKEVTGELAIKLANTSEVLNAKVFPYQLLTTFLNTEQAPDVVRLALQDAVEVAVQNVPAYNGKVYVCVDVSGSMRSPVTGNRGSVTTKVSCVHVAALVAAAVLRKNPSARIIPFERGVVNIKLNPRDSIMTNANALANICGGGTNCSAPLALLNSENAEGDLVIYVSDNESWVDSVYKNNTAMQKEWAAFKGRNKNAKLVCIDIQPSGTAQVLDNKSILNVGGFSDEVFNVINDFLEGNLDSQHLVGVIKNLEL